MKTALVKSIYEIEMPPEEDVLHFSIAKRAKPETQAKLRITIPRLKWRICREETWTHRLLVMKREELLTGTDLSLLACTNDFGAKYELLSTLESDSGKLQEDKFVRKGMTYVLPLNQFYDTINKNKGKISLKAEIQKSPTRQSLSKIDIIHFPEIVTQKPVDKVQKPLEKPFKSLRPMVKCSRGIWEGMRKGRGFSKGEIARAGLSRDDVRRLGIRLDKRRRSMHLINVEALKASTGGEQ